MPVAAIASALIIELLERFPIQWNRNVTLHWCFVAVSWREPVSTSLEIALERDDEEWNPPFDAIVFAQIA
jgi:hypothetical protein